MCIRMLSALAVVSLFLPLCPGQQAGVPALTVENKPELGLEILSAEGAKVSPTEISGLKCTVRNSGHKPVEAFVVVWHVTRGSGAVQIFNHIWDNSLAKGMPKLLPGDSVTVTSGKYRSTPENPFRGVTAQVDYVRYTDGTSTGPNAAKLALMLDDRRMAAGWLRSYLLKVYNERGLEALLEELRPSR